MIASRTKEAVHHPSHYGGDTTYEVIKVIEAWGLDKDFLLGNTLKYIGRNGKKDDEIQELEKAAWYLDRKITNLKKEREKKDEARRKRTRKRRVIAKRSNSEVLRRKPKRSGSRVLRRKPKSGS